VEIEATGLERAAPFELTLETGAGEATAVSVDPGRGRLAIDRSRSGRVAFHPAFAGRHEAPLRVVDGRCRLRLLLDASSLEVFAQDGETTATSILFPTGGTRALSLTARGAAAPAVGSITIHELAGLRPRAGR
jgi:sucrose-6-phosphate hydrolase SacC (GH32 family)